MDLAPKLERIVNKPEEKAHSCNGYRSVYSTGGTAAKQSSDQERVTKLSYLWSANYVQSARSGTERCTEEYSKQVCGDSLLISLTIIIFFNVRHNIVQVTEETPA